MALAATMACVSCSSNDGAQEREYTLPESFCGFGIQQSLADPLYPPGNVLEQREMTTREEGRFPPLGDCAIYVDEERAVFLSAVPAQLAGGTEGLRGHLGYHDDTEHDPGAAERQTAGAQQLTVWPDLAVSSVTCLSSTRDNSYLTLGLRLHWADDDQDLSTELTAAIEPLMDEFLERQAPGVCETA